jgi:hypothetical protein
MGRIIEQIVKNPRILKDYQNKPEINLVKVQTVTGSTYLGYIKDSDEEGVWFEPLMGDFYPTYIFKSDLKKIIVPTNPEEEIEAIRKQKSWFKDSG